MTSETKPMHRFRAPVSCFIAAIFLSIGTFTAAAQNPAPEPPSSAASITPNDTNESSWPIDQLLPLTVSEAWQLSGKDEAKFFDIVQELAAFSAEKRGLKLPDDAAAGKRAGEYIKTQAKADHGQLLYAIVDRAVRRVGTQSTTAAK